MIYNIEHQRQAAIKTLKGKQAEILANVEAGLYSNLDSKLALHYSDNRTDEKKFFDCYDSLEHIIKKSGKSTFCETYYYKRCRKIIHIKSIPAAAFRYAELQSFVDRLGRGADPRDILLEILSDV